MSDLQTALIKAGYKPPIPVPVKQSPAKQAGKQYDSYAGIQYCMRNVTRCGASGKLRYCITH